MIYSFFLRLALRVGLFFTRSNYLQIASATRQRQWWPRAKRADLQENLIEQLLSHATETVPYYDSIGTNKADLSQLSVLTKADVEAAFPDKIVSTTGNPAERRWQGTGGTTHRINVITDFQKRDIVRALELVAYSEDNPYSVGRRMTTIPPDACSRLCAVDGTRDTSVAQQLLKMFRGRRLFDHEEVSNLRGLIMNNWVQCCLILEPFGPDGTHISPERLQHYIERIRESRPVMLRALPEYLLALSRQLEASQQKLVLPSIKPMGGLMSTVMKQRVEDAFGTVVREDYGSSDLGPMAFDCRERNGLHLFDDHYQFELLRNGETVPEGDVGLVHVTDLQNRVMPLIRYQLGDLATIDSTPCQCGRTTPRITLEGRLQDTIVLPTGGLITARMACDFFYQFEAVEEFQLIENDASLQLAYVESASHSLSKDVLRTQFQLQFQDTRELRFRRVRTILPETSGKFRHVKSRSYRRFDVPPTP